MKPGEKMTLPVVAITNASTVLNDRQVEACISALQRQVSIDFRAYWNLECQLTFLPKSEKLAEGWWQMVVLDDPDQAGVLGYHELTSDGTPLGKVFAGLDLRSGSSWTVTVQILHADDNPPGQADLNRVHDGTHALHRQRA